MSTTRTARYHGNRSSPATTNRKMVVKNILPSIHSRCKSLQETHDKAAKPVVNHNSNEPINNQTCINNDTQINQDHQALEQVR